MFAWLVNPFGDRGEPPAVHRHLDSSNGSWHSEQDRTPTDFCPESEGDQSFHLPWQLVLQRNLKPGRSARGQPWRIFRGTQSAGRAGRSRASRRLGDPVSESGCLRFRASRDYRIKIRGILRAASQSSDGQAQVSRQNAAVQRACGPAEICPEEARIGRPGRWAENLTPGLRCCSPPDRGQFRDGAPNSATYRARSTRRPAAGCYLHEISDGLPLGCSRTSGLTKRSLT